MVDCEVYSLFDDQLHLVCLKGLSECWFLFGQSKTCSWDVNKGEGIYNCLVNGKHYFG